MLVGTELVDDVKSDVVATRRNASFFLPVVSFHQP